MTTETDVGLILAAAHFAAEQHRDQRRKDLDATPYINHPLALANLLWNEGGVRDSEVIAAALLHDTIEDTKTTREDLVRQFGERVAGLVEEVTDDKRLPKAERKRLQVEHAPHLSPGAALVKIADKTCNLRDVAACPPADWPLDRRQQYFDWAKQVVDALGPVEPGLRAAFDAAYRARP
ncbi:MAG: HD domain-containing protein [Steroidobacteraceae bacterium]|jgi:guanosine-3',5'-bis(diphosphate) 3'-pyrophosphohydrolase|nr:HD domain-containing protein [Steroidobacteraceae bacterium]